MTERGAPLLFCRILAPPNAPPPMIPKYFTILMTEMRDAIITILNYLNDRDEGRYYHNT